MPYPPNFIPLLLPMLLWFALGPVYIGFLKRKMLGQFIREEGPQHHQQKAGTPTMGGFLIVGVAILTLLGYSVLNPKILTPQLGWALAVLGIFLALGFSDDWLKITKQKNKGLSGWSKLAIQGVMGLALGLWVYFTQQPTHINIFHWGSISMGWLYPVFAMLMVTGASNAYNLADGLDGLAGGTGFFTFIGLFCVAALYPELQLLSLLLAGGCLGFLFFNRHPAQIFMGDTGSLALGGVMAAICILIHQELALLLLGGVYVIETLSVILQVSYFKLSNGKRLFKMSPLHHHFELMGWPEPLVVLMFVLAQALLSVGAILLYNNG